MSIINPILRAARARFADVEAQRRGHVVIARGRNGRKVYRGPLAEAALAEAAYAEAAYAEADQCVVASTR